MSSKWVPPVNDVKNHVGSDTFGRMSVDSRVVSARLPPADFTKIGEPLTVPIFHSSVYRNTSTKQYLDILDKGGYIYQRLGNPTNETAELMINELEQGAGTLLFCSGLAAMNEVLLTFLNAGDHMICTAPCYSGTYKFITETLTRFGVTVTFVSGGPSEKELQAAVNKNTKIVYAETPGNPTMSIVDLDLLAAFCQRHSLMSVVDGTFASPYNQQPIKHGIDIVLHSCSKYLGGHSDLIAGCVTTASLEHWRALKTHQATTGTTLVSQIFIECDGRIPADPWYKNVSCSNAPAQPERIGYCQLSGNTSIGWSKHSFASNRAVWYPGLASHPEHQIAAKQMHPGFSGMISFSMADAERAKRVVENVRLINLSVSLGGTESLMEHPHSMTHGPMFGFTENKSGTPDPGATDPALIRFSVGLEDAEDLINDLKTALNKAV